MYMFQAFEKHGHLVGRVTSHNLTKQMTSHHIPMTSHKLSFEIQGDLARIMSGRVGSARWMCFHERNKFYLAHLRLALFP